MPKQARHIYTYTIWQKQRALAGYPRTHTSITSQPTASTLTSWGFSCTACLSSATRTDRGWLARCGMRDMPTEGAKGARSDQQPPAANHCQPASPKGYGEVNRGGCKWSRRNPPSVAAAAQQRSPAARSSIPPAHAVWLSPGSTCRLPSMRVCALLVGQDSVREGGEKKKK